MLMCVIARGCLSSDYLKLLSLGDEVLIHGFLGRVVGRNDFLIIFPRVRGSMGDWVFLQNRGYGFLLYFYGPTESLLIACMPRVDEMEKVINASMGRENQVTVGQPNVMPSWFLLGCLGCFFQDPLKLS